MSNVHHPPAASLREPGAGEIVSAGDALRLIDDGDTAATGGFVDVSHNASKVTIFGLIAAGGLKVALSEGRLRFLEDGMARKFVEEAAHCAHCAFGGPRLAAPGRQTRFQMLAAGSP